MSIRHLNPNFDEAAPVKKVSKPKDIKYYYDYHPTKEDLMGESVLQFNLIQYLKLVLDWLYRDEGWFVAANLNIYQTRNPNEYPLSPDVAFFKGLVVPEAEQDTMRSWKMWQPERPAPSVTFEVCSDSTWREDLNLKPTQYKEMGVKEYFAYDPHQPGVWRVERKPTNLRLRGWSYTSGELEEITPNEQGWLWSNQMEKWLVPDGKLLRIYDQDGTRCLIEAEAERRAKVAESKAKEAESRAKEAEQAAMQELLAKLRAKGIDPDNL